MADVSIKLILSIILCYGQFGTKMSAKLSFLISSLEQHISDILFLMEGPDVSYAKLGLALHCKHCKYVKDITDYYIPSTVSLIYH
jgi:hypothetical protein